MFEKSQSAGFVYISVLIFIDWGKGQFAALDRIIAFLTPPVDHPRNHYFRGNTGFKRTGHHITKGSQMMNR